jgi:hypothetical protein
MRRPPVARSVGEEYGETALQLGDNGGPRCPRLSEAVQQYERPGGRPRGWAGKACREGGVLSQTVILGHAGILGHRAILPQ